LTILASYLTSIINRVKNKVRFWAAPAWCTSRQPGWRMDR